jgi:hypothetical protein
MTAGRFVLAQILNGEESYVTSWDTWEECEVAFESLRVLAPRGEPTRRRMPGGFYLKDGETGRVWHPGARYEWEAAST